MNRLAAAAGATFLAVQTVAIGVAVSLLTDGHEPVVGDGWTGVRCGFLDWQVYLDVDALPEPADRRFLTRRGLRRSAGRSS